MQAVEFQRAIVKKVSPPGICLAYDGQASILFKAWKGKSKLVLDLTIGIPQYYLTIEKGADYNHALLKEADEFHNRLYNIYFDEIGLADIILCGSEYVKQTVTFFRPQFADKCCILPYGVHLEDFGFPERQFTEKKNLKFVAVGTVDERKGADTLIAAWRQFAAQYPEVELHFFGAIHQKEIVEKELPPSVFLHGRVDKTTLIAALKEMDVFVLPTLHEGSSLAIFQAMAMQLPVITTFNSGTVLKHGESCELVPIKDVTALHNALTKLYTNFQYRKMLGQNAYKLSNQYTWEDYAKRLDEILSNLIG
jgi:glycosyltransferase involved in cell wall biosynthesis